MGPNGRTAEDAKMTATHDPSDKPFIRTKVLDGVLLVELDRPHRRNALVPEMRDHYAAALLAGERDPSVRVIVVTGAGDDFCVGGDGAALAEIGDGAPLQLAAGRSTYDTAMIVSKPTIAAVNGACAGAGLTIALMCDLRFADSRARFSTAFARRGLTAEAGLSWILPRLVGVSNALDLLLSGRVVRAPEALSLGLVSRVVDGPVANTALQYARDLVETCSPWSMAVIKRQVMQDLESTYAEARARADTLLAASLERGEFQDAAKRWMRKEKAEWQPLEEDWRAVWPG
jgi:enoyl-CoA hydratase/carnithine racemase